MVSSQLMYRWLDTPLWGTEMVLQGKDAIITSLSMYKYASVKIISNEVGCRENTVPKL